MFTLTFVVYIAGTLVAFDQSTAPDRESCEITGQLVTSDPGDIADAYRFDDPAKLRSLAKVRDGAWYNCQTVETSGNLRRELAEPR